MTTEITTTEPLAPALLDFAPSSKQPAKVYLAALAPTGRVTQQHALDKCAAILTSGACDHETLDWSHLRFAHVAALRSRLEQDYNFQYVNKILAALRGVMQAAWQLELISERDWMHIKAVKNVKGFSLLAGRSLSLSELRALLQSCEDGTIRGIRDAALLGLLIGAGLRRSEPVNLDVEDYDAAEESVTIRGGKGNKDRVAYVADGLSQHVNRWLQYRPAVAGALLFPLRKGGAIEVRRMTDNAVYEALLYRADLTKIKCTPHDLRRSFISEAIDQGHSLTAIRDNVGHASVAQTAKYDRSGAKAQKRLANSLNLGNTQGSGN